MIFRALDSDEDWTYGRGKNDFLSGVDAIAIDIKTRLQSFVGDCFFSSASGVDWFNLLGSKDRNALRTAIITVILQTSGVTGVKQLALSEDENRGLSVFYEVTTVYTGLTESASTSTLIGEVGFLVDENGNFITTEGGNRILVG